MRVQRIQRTAATRVLWLTLVMCGAHAAAEAESQAVNDTTQQISIQGTVEAVDYVGRTVTLRGEQGSLVTLDVPANAARFQQVKVGDRVTATYYDRISVRLKPAAEPAVDRVVEPTTTATPGTLPGATRTRQRVTTVTITGWSPADKVVTFIGPNKVAYSRRLLDSTDPKVLEGLKVGDRVDVTRTEAITVAVQGAAQAQDAKSSMEIYGFAMLDMGLDFKSIDPDWYDTLRVTRLPAFEGEFGEDHNSFAGVRQSRLGVRTSTPTSLGELKTIFEFELFGTGVDSGQTTFRLRHAWGEVGQFGAGQYWSPFTDPDTFPNSLEYWGPTGLAWYRNVQFRWTPVADEHSNLMVALERPGASGDQGVYADRIELENIKARFPMPDITAAYKSTQSWGYARVAGQLRVIKWDDLVADQFDLSGSATGWGLNLSTNLKATAKDVIRAAFVVGEGIQNSMNDSPVDIGIRNNLQNPITPVEGKPVPMTALSLFVDHTWNAKFTSSVGYSRQDNDNTDGQAPSAFRDGQYALGNLLYTPVPNVMMGGELQWGRRTNFADGFSSDGLKLQFSFKYNFSHKLGG